MKISKTILIIIPLALITFLVVLIKSTLFDNNKIQTSGSAIENTLSLSNCRIFYTTVNIIDKDGNFTPIEKLGTDNFSISESHAGEIIKTKIVNVQPIGKSKELTNINIVFVIDNSGSMNEKTDSEYSKIKKVKDAVKSLIESIRQRQTATNIDYSLAVLPFSSKEITFFHDRSSDIWHENVFILHKYVDQLQASGNTPLWDAINSALDKISAKEGYKIIIVLTDGLDNASSITFEQLIKILEHKNIPIFSIGYGLEEFAFQSLERLSILSGAGENSVGSYMNIGPNEVVRIFDTIGDSVASAYKVCYEPAFNTPGSQVLVEMKVVYKTLFGTYETSETRSYQVVD